MKRSILLLAALLPFSTAALAQSTLTLVHGKVPDPTYIDLGSPGDSVGDQRIWQFDAKTPEGQPAVMDWIMTTTGKAQSSGLESRITLAVVSFPDAKDNHIVIQGVGFYPAKGSTVKTDATLVRAVIGGTGKYAGASGTVLTTHLPDGTWTHVLTLE